MLNPINLVLLYGGKSGEHEVSLVSAASVLANLDSTKYRVIPIGVDKEGRYYVNDYQELLIHTQSLPVSTAASKPLTSLVVDGHLAVDADVIFPVMHGPLYEDGCLQGLLELADVAYVGCGVLSSAIGMDKDMARRIVANHGIQSTRYRSLSSRAKANETEAFCNEIASQFNWPLFIKPCSMGSSVGIHKANNRAELAAAVADARRYDYEIMVEEGVNGREIEVSVLENPSSYASPKVSLPGEIVVRHPDGYYSYAAKYLESEQTDLVVPAPLSDELTARLQQASAEIFKSLKCKGLARVDFFVDDKNDKIYFNEINTLPGFTPISMYPRMWQASGLPYAALLDNLIHLAILHHENRRQLVRHYQ